MSKSWGYPQISLIKKEFILKKDTLQLLANVFKEDPTILLVLEFLNLN